MQANGRDVPFSVGEYQEYNEAMLKAHIPADEDVYKRQKKHQLLDEDF